MQQFVNGHSNDVRNRFMHDIKCFTSWTVTFNLTLLLNFSFQLRFYSFSFFSSYFQHKLCRYRFSSTFYDPKSEKREKIFRHNFLLRLPYPPRHHPHLRARSTILPTASLQYCFPSVYKLPSIRMATGNI